MQRRLRIIIPLVVLAIGVGGFMALLKTRPEGPAASVSERVWRVTTETIELQALAPSVLLHGRVESPRHIRLRSAIEADVRTVVVSEGQVVAAGERLLSLDQRELDLQHAQRQAEHDEIQAQIDLEQQRRQRDHNALQHEQALLNLAERGATRAQDLLGRDLGSQAALDEAQRVLEQQRLTVSNRQAALTEFEARMAQLRARLRRSAALLASTELDQQRSHYTAPFPARITQIAVASGDRVRVGESLIELFDLSALEVRATLPTRHLATVEAALAQEVPLLAQADVDGHGLSLVLRGLAGSARGAGVEALFEIVNPHAELSLGRFVSLRLELPVRHPVVALPFEALYGTDRVYRLEEQRMRVLHVERVGEWQAADGEVRLLVSSAELNPGDRIITTRLPNAVDGLQVTE